LDPISQGALGASWAQSTAAPSRLLPATLIGAASGMAPDFDVFIRSSTDPILFLEFHRHFTHSLAFVPIGALICALALHRLLGKRLHFAQTYAFAFFGFASHGLLDACTTYGTLLLWPFSSTRVAWNIVSVVDPLFTVPLILLVVLAVRKRRVLFSYLGVAWAVSYLLLGVLQHARAVDAVADVAASRGHVPTRVEAMPSIANLILWRSVYASDGKFYVDAVRVGLRTSVFEGGVADRLDPESDLPWLSSSSQQANDLARFRHFANGYLAIDAERPNFVWDMRYAILPNDVDGIWGIQLDPLKRSDEHVEFITNRAFEPGRGRDLLRMLLGR